MFILILALLFGAAVLVYTLKSLNRAKEANGDAKIVKVLKMIVLAEALIYCLLFVFVFLKTLFM